jgi:hypothetical protein
MSEHVATTRTDEQGNVVTLVLLALAVAVLAGMAVLYVLGRQDPKAIQPVGEAVRTPEVVSDDPVTVDPRAEWRTFVSDEYSFSLRYPPGWVVEEGQIGLEPAVTVRPDLGTTTNPGPWDHRATSTHVSVYPLGIPTEGVFGEMRPSDTIVPTPRAVARDYILENGRPFATMVVFEEWPQTWNEAGFVFARASIEDEEIVCLRGGLPVEEDDACDPLLGDDIVRNGFVDPEVRSTEQLILTSFAFRAVKDAPVAPGTASRTDELIKVTTPTPGDTVTSPLVIEGEARGPWYFEASFPVVLETNSGEVLIEAPAVASGEWMTEDFVPFTVSLAYGETTATSGTLILQRANPADLASQANTLLIPVLFDTVLTEER